MKNEQAPEHILHQLADEFLPDCIDYWREFNRYRFNLKQLLPLLPANGSLLDLGAGNGVMSLALQVAGAQVTVADNWRPYSRENTDQEKPSMHHMGDHDQLLDRYRRHNIRTIETDLHEGSLPIEDETFDRGIIMALYKHFPGYPRERLEDTKRGCKRVA